MKIKRIIACILLSAAIFGVMPISAEGEGVQKNYEYEGRGMCIAVLERGFDLSHESFAITDDTPALTKEASDSLYIKTEAYDADGDVKSLYVNAKIPFAYDYGDGDSDVSQGIFARFGNGAVSIASGNGKLLENKKPAANGVAPEAQVLAMKVYSDKKETITAEAVVSAINDSVTLGADVILLAFSMHGGFGSSAADLAVEEAINRADKAGIIVVAPVGEAEKYGLENVYSTTYGGVEAPASSPDVGTVSFPGSIEAVFTVGSVDSNTVETEFLTLPDGTCIPYGDSNYMFPDVTGEKTFADFFGSKTFEYVFIDGLGKEEDYKDVPSVEGKFVVVTRGEISFVEKIANAHARGAVGVIVVDPQPDRAYALTVRMDLTDAKLPAVIVSSGSGIALERAEDKRITINPGELYVTKTRETPTPSSFSAEGTTAELKLKPDIMAVGSSVMCADAMGTYNTLTTVEAAAASIAGMCVCVKEKLNATSPELGGRELAYRIKAMLAGSAELMVSSSDRYYSPRVQGAGAADLEKALASEILLTYNGLPKAELGDGHRRFMRMQITATNLSSEDKSCVLSATVGSDGYAEYTFGSLDSENPDDPLYKKLGKEADDTIAFIKEHVALADTAVTLGDGYYQLNENSPEYEPYKFILRGNSSITFNVGVYLDEDKYIEYKDKFENGFFVEGFIKVEAEDETVSIPYVGFSGDFMSAPYLDADRTEGETPIYNGIYLYRGYFDDAYPDIYSLTLGAKTLFATADKTEIDKNELCFSPVIDRINGMVMLNFGLLRDVTDVTVTVTDESGNVIRQADCGTAHRTYLSSLSGLVTSVQIPIWNGRDPKVNTYIYPNGKYTAAVSYREIGSERIHSLSYTLILDTENPEFVSSDFFMDDGVPMLNVTAKDNNIVRSVNVAGGDLMSEDSWVFDISACLNDYIYIDIYDAAANLTTVRIKNPIHSLVY